MFKLKPIDNDKNLAKKIKNRDFPEEVCQELSQILKILAEKGDDIGKADFLLSANVNKQIKNIDAYSFEMQIVCDNSKKEVIILDLKVKSDELLRARFSIPDTWDNKNVLNCIPQCDKPKKILDSLQYVHQGVHNSYEIGLKLGSHYQKRL